MVIFGGAFTKKKQVSFFHFFAIFDRRFTYKNQKEQNSSDPK